MAGSGIGQHHGSTAVGAILILFRRSASLAASNGDRDVFYNTRLCSFGLCLLLTFKESYCTTKIRQSAIFINVSLRSKARSKRRSSSIVIMVHTNRRNTDRRVTHITHSSGFLIHNPLQYYSPVLVLLLS